MTYRIAIAGLGEALRHIHLPAYQRIPALEVVGGYDPVPDRMRSHFHFSRQFLKCWSEPSRMFLQWHPHPTPISSLCSSGFKQAVMFFVKSHS